MSPQDKISHDKKSFNILESLHVNSQDAHIVQVCGRIVETMISYPGHTAFLTITFRLLYLVTKMYMFCVQNYA